MREPVRFTARDYDGNEHGYEQPWFPPDHATALIVKLAGFFGTLGEPTAIEVSAIVGNNGLLNGLFRGCRRDGQLLDTSAGRIDAYTGNLGEMFSAIKSIMMEQIFPFIPAELLSGLTDSMQSLGESGQETLNS